MLVNPFTARSGMDPKVFIGRDNEIAFFKERLNNALHGRCKHYVITGTWGIGKTVIMRQMKLIARAQGAWALLFCTRAFAPQENLTDFARHVLDMAAADLPIQPRSKESLVQRVDGAGANVLGFGFQLQWRKASHKQDPQLLLRDGLIQLYEHAKAHRARALVILIDDVHNLSDEGHQLTLLRNVLTDEHVLKETRILAVLSSIDQAWKPFLIRDHPVGRLFMPRRQLGYFDKAETLRLIHESLRDSGVVFENTVRNRIFDITRGHVFEIQALCEALFDQQIKGKVSMENWDTALHHTLLALADAQFESMMGRASPQERMALSVLATSETIMSPQNLEKRYSKIKSAAEVLKRLTEKGLVERVERGQYRLSDPLFAEYVKRRMAS